MRNNNMRFGVYMTETQKKIIQIYTQEELKLFNTLNDRLRYQLRTNHIGFLEIAKKLRLYGEAVEHSLSVRNLGEDIPPQLEPIQDDITFLSENALQIMDTAIVDSNISPRMKRNMGVQLFRYYAGEAKAYDPSGNLRSPTTMLESVDLTMKRHVQLHRKTLIVDYNEEYDATLLKIPYLTKSLAIKTNLKKLRWNILILHQSPHETVTPLSNWYIDLKDSDEDYILKYLDNPRPRSVLNSKDYRRVSF